MARIIFAGASGVVSREIIDAILAKKKHEVIGLTQSAKPTDDSGIRWVQVDYSDEASLVQVLQGADFCICGFSSRSGSSSVIATEKALIDASIKAGVKRFIPSEWGTRSYGGVNFYSFKDDIREYLEEVNKDHQVLPYTLFQTGLFLDYFGTPHSTTKHLKPIYMYVDFENRRALTVRDGNFPLSLTRVSDVAAVVAEALDFNGDWPVVGGITGTRITIAELIALGEKIRGPFAVEKLQLDDLRAGILKSSWFPRIEHGGIPSDQIDEMSKSACIEFLRASVEGAWLVSDEWNQLLPHVHLASAEEYLTQIWKGKP